MAAVILSPLDILRTRLQSSSGRLSGMQPHRLLVHIVRKEGVLALWRGLWPTIFGVGPARALYFGGYNLSKRYLGPEGLGLSGTPLHLLGAATAGVFSNTVMSPWWVVRLRLQLQVTPIEPFWRRWFGGATASPALSASAAGSAATLTPPAPAAAARLAAAASAASSAASAASAAGSAAAAAAVPYKGVADAALRIYREEGWRTFYRGLSASYLGVVETALQFAIYGELKRLVLAPRPPASGLVLVDGAAGAASQVPTKPSSSSASVLATRSADRTPFAASAGPAAAAAIGGTRTAAAVAATRAPALQALARSGSIGSSSAASPSAAGSAAGAASLVAAGSATAASSAAGSAGPGPGFDLSRYMPAQAWAFWLSAASKLVAAAASYPHEVLRTRMREQVAGAGGSLKYSGIVQATRLIMAEEGLRGLYGGMGVHLLRTVPNAAILLLVVETMVGGDV